MTKKTFHSLLLTAALPVATSLFLTGCGQSDHAGHDHGDGDHSHATAEAEASETGTAKESDLMTKVAGAMAEGAASLTVIENPSEEQLAGTRPYPSDKCLVSGEDLGSMGDPVVVLVGDQQIKLCCNHCLPDLKKDTTKWMAQLSETK